MISGLQIRAARSALRWSAEKLAKNSSVGLRTIKRLEQFDGIPNSHASTLVAVKTALEQAGIEFIGSADDAPGIRAHKTGQAPPPSKD